MISAIKMTISKKNAPHQKRIISLDEAFRAIRAWQI
jgi:hypothetical protein